MGRRAELVEETRLRITAATARLHTTVGPAKTSIAAIAEEAGVTRLTVYRHFPDLATLFEACRDHWQAEHPIPDPMAWAESEDGASRVRRGLTELYGWYHANADALYPIYRDMATMPRSSQEAMRDDRRRLAALLLGGSLGGSQTRRPNDPRAHSYARHLVDYRTWRSLVIENGLSDAEAAELGVHILTGPSAARSTPAGPI